MAMFKAKNWDKVVVFNLMMLSTLSIVAACSGARWAGQGVGQHLGCPLIYCMARTLVPAHYCVAQRLHATRSPGETGLNVPAKLCDASRSTAPVPVVSFLLPSSAFLAWFRLA